MALVELFRTTGERRYLELAARMIDAAWPGPARRRPVRRRRTGRTTCPCARRRPSPATPSASSTSTAARSTSRSRRATRSCSTRSSRRWRDMLATRTYLTGGLGSRHRDEAFGDPFELPPDRAYAETCAAIASVMLAWRLLLATGEPECADVIERTVYNGVLPGLSLDGTAFFYINVLQRRIARAGRRPGPRSGASRGCPAPAARRT